MLIYDKFIYLFISYFILSNDFKTRRNSVEQMLIDLVLKVEPHAPQARPVI